MRYFVECWVNDVKVGQGVVNAILPKQAVSKACSRIVRENKIKYFDAVVFNEEKEKWIFGIVVDKKSFRIVKEVKR